MRKSIIFSLLLFGCLFFVRPSAVSAAIDVSTDFDFSLLDSISNPNMSTVTLDQFMSGQYDVFAIYSTATRRYNLFVYPSGSVYNFNTNKPNPFYIWFKSSVNPVYFLYRKSNTSDFLSTSGTVTISDYLTAETIYVVKFSSSSTVYIDGESWNPLPPIELNRSLPNNFTISRYRFAGYASVNARFAISTVPQPSSDCDYYWSTTFMGPDLNQVTNMLNEFRYQDSEDLEHWLVNHALDKSYRISNSVTYHHWTNEQMNTFDSRTGLFTIALPNSFIDAYDLSSVPAEDLADVQRIIYFSGYPVLVRMYYENRVTRERSPLTSVEYKPSALAFWDYAGISDFFPDPDDQGFSYTPGELVYDADLSDVTGVLYDVNYFSGWLANIVNAMPTKPLSLAFMTFIVTIIVGVVGVVLR